MFGLNGLTQDEAQTVMQATGQAVKMDVPNINSADAMETMYQMANIAKVKWNSPLSGDIVSKIRSAPEYQKLIQRIKSTGTIYASSEDRALSPYFQAGGGQSSGSSGGVLDQAKAVFSKVPTWAWIAGAGAIALLILLPSGGRRRR